MIRLKGIELGKGPKIAGVIVSSASKAAINKARRDGADVLEFRADTFKDRSEKSLCSALKRLKDSGLPIVLTVRSKREGGRLTISEAERLSIFRKLLRDVDCVDIELSSKKILADVVTEAKRRRKKVVVSYHNFKRTPRKAELRRTIERAKKAGGDAVKIATMCRDAGELKRLASLLCENTDAIVIAMGRYGATSRIFFPFIGSLLTYGSTTGARSGAIAPGQLPVKSIKNAIKLFSY